METVSVPPTILTRSMRISASLICADLCNLQRDLQRLESAGIDELHVDLLDGRFSPSLPIGIDVVRQARRITTLPFDVHLMVEDNEFFIHHMLDIGVQRMCFHCESSRHIDHQIDVIRQANVAVGLALAPATPLDVLEFVAEKLDFVMLMLINPGFAGHAGQSQTSYALRKIAACRDRLDRLGLNLPIEVDGRVCFDTIPSLIAAGADILVAGTRCLFMPNVSFAENVMKMRHAMADGVAKRSSSS